MATLPTDFSKSKLKELDGVRCGLLAIIACQVVRDHRDANLNLGIILRSALRCCFLVSGWLRFYGRDIASVPLVVDWQPHAFE